MEGFVGGGCIGEGKGYDEILVEFWTLWCNKWRWRRKNMMVGSYSVVVVVKIKEKLVVIRVFDGEW